MINSLRTSHSTIDRPRCEPPHHAALVGESPAAASCETARYQVDRPLVRRPMGSGLASAQAAMPPQPRAALSLLSDSSASKVEPNGARGLIDAMGPESGSDHIARRSGMHGKDRSGPGNPQSVPSQWAGSPPSYANPRTLSVSDSGTVSAHGGNVPTQDEPAVVDVAVRDPFIKPAWIEQWHRHLDHYRAAVSETPHPEGDVLSPSDQQALAQIKQGIMELEAMLPLLDGRAPPLGDDFSLQQFRLLAKYALKDSRLRHMVQDLTLKMPELVISRLTNVSQLVFAANGMRKTIGRDSRQFGGRVPELNDYLRQVDQEIKSVLNDATTQSKVQIDILEMVRDASQGFADADLEARNATLGHTIARWMHLRKGSPSELANRIRNEFLGSFGRWLSVHSVGDGRLSISLKPDVVGRESCADLVQTLAHMSLTLRRGRDRAAVRAAIVASQDVHWVRHDGGERLELTPATVERLCAGGAQGLHAVPQAQLRAGIVAAAEGVDVGVLKWSLKRSFQSGVDRLVNQAARQLLAPGGVIHAESKLMQGLMRDLMGSPSVKDMLKLVDAAVAHLWVSQVPWGGDAEGAGELLADIRECIQRYTEPAQLPMP